MSGWHGVEVLGRWSVEATNSRVVSSHRRFSRHARPYHPLTPCRPITRSPRHPRSPEEHQTWYADSSLVQRRRLDVGDDECSSIQPPERYIGNLGAGDRDLLDHLPRGSEDRDFSSTIMGDVEIRGFIERHTVWTLPAGEEGKILALPYGAIRLERVTQDAIVVRLGQIDGSAVDTDRDTIGKG